MKMAKTVEEYISWQSDEWIKGIEILRSLLLTTELVEEVKWGMPTYTLDKKIVIGIGAFKSYFGIWFHNGVFLKDKAKVLINAQEGKTKGMRQWRFTDHKDIEEALLLEYILEAIQNQKEGKIVPIEKPKSKPIVIPQQLADAFQKDTMLSDRFHGLTSFKQKEYCEYISTAKRDATKLSRLEKCIPLILDNKGLNDKYR